MNIDTYKITRFEVIDNKSGRLIARHNVQVVFSLQDNERTLKVFLADEGKEEENEIQESGKL